MKRTPMKPGKPPSRKSRLTRKTRVKPKNAKRAAKRKAEAFGPQAELCRTLPCCVCGLEPYGDRYTHPHHEGHSRGAGGKDEECIPLCWACHQLRHSKGYGTFWKRIAKLGTEYPGVVQSRLRARVSREAA